MPNDDDTKTSEEIAAEESAKLAEEEAAKKAEDDTSKNDDVPSDKEKKAISESRKYQNRAQKAEKELEKIREAKLSEDEKKDLKIKQLTDDKSAADRKLRESKLDSMILNEASKVGFQDLDVVKLLAKQEFVEDDEDISEADVKSVIDTIAKEKAYLLGGSETTRVGAGNFEGGTKVEKEPSVDELFAKELKDKANF